MIRWPGKTVPGMDEEHMVAGIDLMPTLLDGLGIPTPADISQPSWIEPQGHVDRQHWRAIPPAMDGRSFLPPF